MYDTQKHCFFFFQKKIGGAFAIQKLASFLSAGELSTLDFNVVEDKDSLTNWSKSHSQHHFLMTKVFNSPEPKAPRELIV